ncbi:helix-turn-helix transcriptional regulator [Streptomyces sp. WAC06614]|uniref:helix-turn-helix transcriptional regulator n=1 Tax=Streptomyces sp. WAC06614 TaxID=2487416 RepID=UPI00163B7BEB|nr:helix-turn-helix transcriptional regulator [Streptomyces sp. WAC06614]
MRPGRQAQCVRTPLPATTDSSWDTARVRALRHLDRPISLPELAGQAQAGARTLTRRFTAETGVRPLRWLLQLRLLRLLRARELGETTDLTVDHAARSPKSAGAASPGGSYALGAVRTNTPARAAATAAPAARPAAVSSSGACVVSSR